MAAIPKGLGDVPSLIKRYQKARENWTLWRSLHQEACDFAAPQRQTFSDKSQGQEKNRHIFDSTAITGLQQFANRVQGALMPPWTEWAVLAAGSEVPEEDKEKVDKALEELTKKVFASLNHSNFYTELAPLLQDLGIGTGGIMVEDGDFDKGQELRFSNVPLAELVPEKPSSGPIMSGWRCQKVKPCDIARLWPTATLPPSLEKKALKPESPEEPILNAMLFNKELGNFSQIVLHEETKAVLFVQSFDTKRLIVSRWAVTSGEAFGRGPVIQQLPDIRTVNKVKQFMLQNAALQIAGVYTGIDDGIFNPHTVTIAPATVIPVGSNDRNNPSLRPLDRSGDLGLAGLVIDDLQNAIRTALFSDPMGDLTDPVRSATEVMLRNQDMLRNQGASFGRQKSELIEPIIAAVIDILQGLGKFPKVAVDGKEITIKMVSPLAKAEGQEDFQSSQIWMQSLAQLPEEVVAATVKVESLPKYWAESLGVPVSLVRSEEETKKITEEVTAAAQEQIGAGVE